jgi:alpha-glucuronidase
LIQDLRSDVAGIFFWKKSGQQIWLELNGGIDSVRYQPSKEHLDNQIPHTIKKLRDLIQTFQKETGADDPFVQTMLSQLSESYQSSPSDDGGFGFR